VPFRDLQRNELYRKRQVQVANASGFQTERSQDDLPPSLPMSVNFGDFEATSTPGNNLKQLSDNLLATDSYGPRNNLGAAPYAETGATTYHNP
jgi:hypothetical protein